MKISPTHNLAVCYPEIAAQWARSANGDLRPEDVGPGSSEKVGWRCSKDPAHRWGAVIYSRVGGGSGCPSCSGRVATPTNNLSFCFPEIAKQWDYEANFPLRPEDVTSSSGQKVWWKCTKNSTHRWKAAVYSRTGKNKNGCEYCSGHLPSPDHNLAVCYPEIAAQWDFEKNGDVRPENVGPHSGKKRWWRCLENHEWVATVNSRTNSKSGCPTCARSRGRSRAEIEIYEHVLRIYPDTISSDHSALRYFELDVYIPSLKKAVEYDGLHWHSMPHHVDRDRRKDARCVKKGIQLLRITDTEYLQDRAATLAKIERFLTNLT